MGTGLHRVGALSFAAGLAAAVAAAPAGAQPAQPWVDPPSETGTSAPVAAPTHEPQEAKPSPNASTPSASAPATVKVEEPGREPTQRSSEATITAEQRKPLAKSSPPKLMRESKARKSPRSTATARNERPRQVIQPRDVADQAARTARAERVRQGLNSGLEVMTLRTIEFPDGRRVQILTKPRPGSTSEMLAPEE